MPNLSDAIVEYVTEVESVYLYDIYIAIIHRGWDVPLEILVKTVWDLVDDNILNYGANARVTLNAK